MQTLKSYVNVRMLRKKRSLKTNTITLVGAQLERRKKNEQFMAETFQQAFHLPYKQHVNLHLVDGKTAGTVQISTMCIAAQLSSVLNTITAYQMQNNT